MVHSTLLPIGAPLTLDSSTLHMSNSEQFQSESARLAQTTGLERLRALDEAAFDAAIASARALGERTSRPVGIATEPAHVFRCGTPEDSAP
jgi:hypothetical protein